MLLSHLSQPAASCSYSVVHSALCSAVCVLADCSCCAPSLSLTVAFNQHYGPSHGTYYPSHHHKRFPLNEVSPVSPSCPLFMPSSFLLCMLISPSISQSRNIVFFFLQCLLGGQGMQRRRLCPVGSIHLACKRLFGSLCRVCFSSMVAIS